MGKQINFFATDSDFMQLQQTLLAVAPYNILLPRSTESAARVVPNLQFTDNGQQQLFFFVARSEDLSKIKFNYVVAQGYWSVNVLKSPVIELHRGLAEGRRIDRSRLYFTESYFDDSQKLTRKSDDFCKWANSIFSKSRRIMVRKEMDYICPDAARLVESNSLSLNME
jgi:hypothetical protein